MHPALLIDEILEAVLDSCSDWEQKEYQFAAAQIARTCSAWKDPAVDRIWRRLNNVLPLVNLLEGSCGMDTEPIFIPREHGFHSYAERVKEIVLTRCPPALSSEQAGLLPNLRVASLTRKGCLVPISWILSEHLESLNVNLGLVHDTLSAQNFGANVAHCLERWQETFPDAQLLKLNIRGWLCPSLAQTIASITSLRSLFLMCGASITPELLRAITTLPSLETLSIQARGITAEDFDLVPPSSNVIPFPRLRDLLIYAQPRLLTAMIDLLQPNTLTRCSLSVESPKLNASYWKSTLDLIVAKAANTLHRFEFFHGDELDDAHPPIPPLERLDLTFTLDSLRPLARLQALQSLMIDTSIPPELTDRDLEEVIGWWPDIESIHLGTLPYLEAVIQQWHPKSTIAVLPVIARKCPKLSNLAIPLDPSAPTSPLSSEGAVKPLSICKPTERISQHTLRCLTVSCHPSAKVPSAFVQDVLDIFPDLRFIECDTGHDLGSLKSLYVRELASQCDDKPDSQEEKRTGTEDGLANGH